MTEITGPADFWGIIERSNATYDALERELEVLDANGLERFYGLFSVLADDALIEDIIYYEAMDLFLSEDGMEDFGWWVLMQGEAFFEALTSEELPLQEALAMHMNGEPKREWVAGENRKYRATNLLSLVREIYEAEHGVWDDSYERERALRETAYALRDAEYGG